MTANLIQRCFLVGVGYKLTQTCFSKILNGKDTSVLIVKILPEAGSMTYRDFHNRKSTD